MLKPKKKLTRKQIKEDKVLTNINNMINFINENSRILTFGLIGLIAAVVIGFMIVRSKQEANVRASGRLLRATDFYNAQQYDQAIPILEQVTTQFKGTKNAGVAVYYLAKAYYFKENYDKAKEYFSKYIDDYGGNKLFISSSLAGIAACYSQEGDKEQAATYYTKAAKKSPDLFISADYLFSAAQNYIDLQKKETAKDLLQKIVDQYSDSGKSNEAKILLAQLTTGS